MTRLLRPLFTFEALLHDGGTVGPESWAGFAFPLVCRSARVLRP